ncbi:MAG: hypothetical protein LBV80_08720 [Deltaproteobacteria bacterium]|jgi:tripartite-type tricarboxylate transporter receptor subunit TctC|nr:hypothetical protein [Deltaproteobacteria bacterium]
MRNYHYKLRGLLLFAFTLALAATATRPVREAAALQALLPYPSQDSVILHPYDPGDASGKLLLLMRPFYASLSGRDFTIQSRPGRGGASAWNHIGSMDDNASMSDDGYALTLTDLPNLALLSQRTHPAFDINELRNACLLASMPLMLWTPADSKLADLYDLVGRARENPGQIVLAGLGVGTVQHLANLRLDRLAGIKTTFISYSGDSSARQAALDGKALAFWGHSDPALALALTAEGRRACRPLAVAATQRHPLFPETPTFAELGYDLIEISHFGLAISAKTNAKTSQSVSAAWLNLARNQDFQKAIERAGFTPAPVGAFELSTYLNSLLAYYAEQRADYNLQ